MFQKNLCIWLNIVAIIISTFLSVGAYVKKIIEERLSNHTVVLRIKYI